MNDDIYKGKIGNMLTDREDLNMREVVSKNTGRRLGATYFTGTKPIDGIWATKGLQVESASVMPVGFGVGDHRLFVIDLLTTLLVGHAPTKMVRPATRRLSTKIGQAARKYITNLEANTPPPD